MVTGGGSGLGAATVRRLREGGAAVASIDAADDPPIDVTDPVAVHELIDALSDLRVLVCCAGTGSGGGKVVRRSGPHALEDFERVVQVNLVGTFNCVRLAAAAMAESQPLDTGERGVIVMTSSIAFEDGVTGGVAYSASKAGVVGMTLPLARDLGPVGVRVVTIAPGPMDTPMSLGLPHEYAAQLSTDTPFPQRFGRPEEFAALVAHIVENPMLNGEVIRLDGGLRMRPLEL